MKKQPQTIDESIDKIKFMMNYDSSKTLIEQLESPGSIAGKTALATGGGAALGAGAAAGTFAATSTTTGLTLAATNLGASMGFWGGAAAAAGGAAIAGAAALALTPLVLWLIDKDKAYPKTKKLFDYVKENKEKIDQVERGLDDDTIQQLSDNLYDAMKGLGTRNKMVFQVFNSLVTISDFAALINTFNEDHMNEGSGDLLEWLDSDIDISSTWNKIYVPLRNIVKKFAKKMAAENPQPNKPDGTADTGGYTPVEGTNESPYKLGTSGAGIFKVQECIGFTGADVDGKFGPKTQAKLAEYAKVYSRGFTNDDIEDICKMANPRRDPQIAGVAAIKPIPTKDETIKSPIKMPTLAPKVDTQTLRPMKLAPLAPTTPTPEKKGFLGGIFKGKK